MQAEDTDLILQDQVPVLPEVLVVAVVLEILTQHYPEVREHKVNSLAIQEITDLAETAAQAARMPAVVLVAVAAVLVQMVEMQVQAKVV